MMLITNTNIAVLSLFLSLSLPPFLSHFHVTMQAKMCDREREREGERERERERGGEKGEG